MPCDRELSNEVSFFVYLLEKYAEHRDTGARQILELLDGAGLTDYVMQMYPMYHTERIENAFRDIDRRLAARDT
jgi:hypothetical protein